jgi:hypothetical protein
MTRNPGGIPPPPQPLRAAGPFVIMGLVSL